MPVVRSASEVLVPNSYRMVAKTKECVDYDIDIESPQYDQSTYMGRAMHFFQVTNPLNLFASAKKLENAKNIVTKYRCKEDLGKCITEKELWRAKVLYDSAFHPDTGEKMMFIGRMSAQVPMNMIITGGLLSFYKSTPAVIFWQWINQSFNAAVNHTNRSGDATISKKQLLTSYVLATGGAMATAISLNKTVERFPPIVGRFVPFVAVGAANAINIPLMRSQELREGTTIFDEHNNKIGSSTSAAESGVTKVIFSRILMAAPGMMISPFIMNHLERRGTLCRYPWSVMPLQLVMVGFFLTFATPLACACFQQRASMKFHKLEAPLQRQLIEKYKGNPPPVVYYNKGL